MSRQIITLEPAFVLHTRAYRDTSLLVDFFTQHYGRIHAVARGARGSRSRLKGLLQPFVPLLISWSGQTELHTLRDAEPQNSCHYLPSEKLLAGLYLNELLVRLLHRHDPHPQLYLYYQQTLQQLALVTNEQTILRLIEKKLLHELGYGLPLTHDCHSGAMIVAEKFYQFDATRGFSLLQDNYVASDAVNVFSGKSLLALELENLLDIDVLRDTKRLMRLALATLLGAKPIKSRELFLQKGRID